jgi:hypothetical protein
VNRLWFTSGNYSGIWKGQGWQEIWKGPKSRHTVPYLTCVRYRNVTFFLFLYSGDENICSEYYCRVVVLHGKWYESLEIRLFTRFMKRETLFRNIVLLWSTFGCYSPFLIVLVGGMFVEHFRFLKSKKETTAREGKGTKLGGGGYAFHSAVHFSCGTIH